METDNGYAVKQQNGGEGHPVGCLESRILYDWITSKYQDSKYRSLRNFITININDTLCIFASWQNRSVPRVCIRGVFLRGGGEELDGGSAGSISTENLVLSETW